MPASAILGKFFETLRSTGAQLVIERGFGDHHEFTEEEASDLLNLSAKNDLEIITTSKDMARLKDSRGKLAELEGKSQALEVQLEFEPADQAAEFIDRAVQAFKKRRLSGSRY